MTLAGLLENVKRRDQDSKPTDSKLGAFRNAYYFNLCIV